MQTKSCKKEPERGIFTSDPASRMNHFSLSPTAAMMAKAAELCRRGKDIISLNVVEPDFDTPEFIRTAAKDAIETSFPHYTTESGFPELRLAIAKKPKTETGIDYALNEIATAVGAKKAPFTTMMESNISASPLFLPKSATKPSLLTVFPKRMP